MIIDKLQKEFYYKKLQLKLELYKRQLSLWKVVKEVLLQFDGKQVTRRIATAVKNKLEEENVQFNYVHYSTEYGMYHVNISFNILEEKQPEYLRVLLGYHSCKGKLFNAKLYIEEKNACYSDLEEHIDATESAFDNLDEWIERYNNIDNEYNELRDAMKEFHCEYLLPMLREA